MLTWMAKCIYSDRRLTETELEGMHLVKGNACLVKFPSGTEFHPKTRMCKIIDR